MNESVKVTNDAERYRLLALTARLTKADLAREMPNGWSVATTLAHLAFWDIYYCVRIAEWARAGLDASPVSIDATNEAVRRLSSAIPSTAVVGLVVEAAEAIDDTVGSLAPDLAAAIDNSGHTRALRRAMHRREHLDQIEKQLGPIDKSLRG